MSPEKCVNPDCKRKHVCSGKVCAHPLYKEYGRCPKYFKGCEDTHPFTQQHIDKWGSKSVAYDAMLKAVQANPSLAVPVIDR